MSQSVWRDMTIGLDLITGLDTWSASKLCYIVLLE